MYIKQQTCDYINKIFETYNDSSQTATTKRMHPNLDDFEKVFANLKLKPQDINLVRIEESNNPIAVPPHADSPKGYVTTIVPLKFFSPVHTILFESFYTGTNSRGYKYRPTNNRYYKDEWLSEDYDSINNINDTAFDNDDYEKYLSYMSIDDLHGLKIQKCVKWENNSVIQFPSHQLHSGSNFRQSKRWLLILSTSS